MLPVDHIAARLLALARHTHSPAPVAPALG